MVTNTAAVEAVTEGPDGILAGLAPGKVYIDMSTASPENTRATAERVRESGADMLDAPVSGSVITLEQGKLSVMVGGDARAPSSVSSRCSSDRAEGVRTSAPNGLALCDEDRDQPEPRGADARLLRRRAAGREERHRAREAPST